MSAMSDMTKRSIWLLSLAILFVGYTQLTSATANWAMGNCDISCAGNNRVYECDFYDQDGHSACDLGECYLEGYCCGDDVETAGAGVDSICYNLSWGTAGHGSYWAWASGCSTDLESQQTACGSGVYRRVAYAQMYCSFYDPVACP